MKEKATIYDLWRMCNFYMDCLDCPMKEMDCDIRDVSLEEIDKISEIILNWCKEHPVKTRQDKFLEMFPNADTKIEFIDICPHVVDCDYACKNRISNVGFDCNDCKKSYWLAEVEE